MSFSTQSLRTRLENLSMSQESIETLSLWLMHHRANAKQAVGIWLQELEKAPPKKKLSLIYLANDLILQSRTKGNDYRNSFESVLVRALSVTYSTCDGKVKKTIDRILKIWQERGAYSAQLLQTVRAQARETSPSDAATTEADVGEYTGPPVDRRQVVTALQVLSQQAESAQQLHHSAQASLAAVGDPASISGDDALQQVTDMEMRASSAQALMSSSRAALTATIHGRDAIVKALQRSIGGERNGLLECQQAILKCKADLQKATLVQKILREHIAAIPDLDGNTTQNLMSPLPNASDLFGAAAPSGNAVPAPVVASGRARSLGAKKKTIPRFTGPRIAKYDPEQVSRKMMEDEMRAADAEAAGTAPKKAKQADN